jgi:H+/Cl- antiporter ClcA
MICPAVPMGAFAIVGGAAFLATSLDMPVTAIMLVIEFTHVSHDFWAPIVFAVIGSVAAAKLWAALASRALPKEPAMAPVPGSGR